MNVGDIIRIGTCVRCIDTDNPDNRKVGWVDDLMLFGDAAEQLRLHDHLQLVDNRIEAENRPAVYNSWYVYVRWVDGSLTSMRLSKLELVDE